MSTEQSQEYSNSPETISADNVAKLIDYAKNGNAIEFRNTFRAEMDSRINNRIEAQKQTISAQFGRRISGQ
jgi:hypothetical protein